MLATKSLQKFLQFVFRLNTESNLNFRRDASYIIENYIEISKEL